MAEAISGVPQGSVIGPILFVIYANNLPDHLSADSLLYADDAYLITPRNHHDMLHNSLNNSASWSKDWELDLNPTKGSTPLISSLTPARPITNLTPRPYQQSAPPKTWESS